MGDCVGPFTLQLLDAAGQATWADELINAAVDRPHDDEWLCNHLSADKAVPILGGNARGVFYLHAESSGTLRVTVSVPGLTSPGPVDVAVGPPPDPHTVNGWGCSSGGTVAGWLAFLLLLYWSRGPSSRTAADVF